MMIGEGKGGPWVVVRWGRSSTRNSGRGSGGTAVLSEEAQIGKRVRIRDDHQTLSWRGQEGTITKRWGDPTYTALDVLLKCGLVGSERKDVLGAKLAFDARWE
jgi:hypothetical protein